MEALAATSSIAAILGLVGHSIEGIVKLRSLFADVASASQTISRFLNDLNVLLQNLHEIENIIAKIRETETPSGSLMVDVASLNVQLEDCNKDIFIWLQTARDLRPAGDGGRRAWFKKFWISINQASVKHIREEAARHSHALELSLAILGR